MKLVHTLITAVVALVVLPHVGPVADPPVPADNLSTVLAELDTASQGFTNARADFVWDYYEAVVKDTSTQNGTIYFQHAGATTQMGAVVMDARSKGPDKVLEYKGGLLRMFDPHDNQIRLIKAGANQAQYESFLTLGFGGSGKALAQAWTVTDQGSETLNDSGQPVKTEKLDLVSKDQGVRNMFTHVTIWVDTTRGVSLKQVFETPSHDRRTATYSHIKLNGKVDTSAFAIKPNSKTTTVGP